MKSGQWLEPEEQRNRLHICPLPFLLFRRQGRLWQCTECNQVWRICTCVPGGMGAKHWCRTHYKGIRG